MSTPIRAPLWISGCGGHLLSKQIDEQHWCLALRAVTAQANGSAEQVALRTTTLADEALGTTRALVDRLRHQRAAPLQLLAQTVEIHVGVLAEAEGALLVGTRTIARASRGECRTAHQAADRTITRAVTHGQC